MPGISGKRSCRRVASARSDSGVQPCGTSGERAIIQPKKKMVRLMKPRLLAHSSLDSYPSTLWPHGPHPGTTAQFGPIGREQLKSGQNESAGHTRVSASRCKAVTMA